MLKHVKTRWLSLERVLVRIIEQYKNLKEYFFTTIKTQFLVTGNEEENIRLRELFPLRLTVL